MHIHGPEKSLFGKCIEYRGKRLQNESIQERVCSADEDISLWRNVFEQAVSNRSCRGICVCYRR